MPVAIQDRPTETVREEVIDKLIMNYSHGEISHQAFERRLDQAMASQDNAEIAALAEDLPLDTDNQYQQSKAKDLGYTFEAGTAEDVEYMVNIFSGSTKEGVWKVPRELRVFSVFSGSDIDFSQARFVEPVTTIKVFSLFSGDNIYVPEHVNVVSKAFCVFGSIDSKTAITANTNAPTIIVEGLSIFSGIDIKVKRTIKERFVEFADQLKRMFS